jgi:uncharacterized protein with von Willebrand factor type A (vWA) domain
MRELNRKLLEWAGQAPGFEASRSTTINRMIVSARSAELLSEMLLTDPEVKKAMEEQDKADKQEQQAQELEQRAQQQEAGGDPGGAAASQAQAAAKHAQAAATSAQASARMEQRIEQKQMQAVRAAAVKEAEEGGEEVAAQLSAWGMEDGDPSEVDPEQVAEALAQLGEDEIVEITAMMGKAKGVAMKHASKRSNFEVVTTDGGYTKKFMDLFPMERMKLSPKAPRAARAKAMLDYVDHGALGLVKSSEPKYRGTIVLGIDGSGSMGGDRNVLAKALSLGMFAAAEANEQEFAAFIFGSRREQSEPITQDTPAPERMAFALKIFGGGTNFDAALRRAYEIVADLEDPTSADVVLITDGEAGIDEDTKALHDRMKLEHGTRFIALLVDNASAYADVREVADAVISLATRSDIASAAEALASTLWE